MRIKSISRERARPLHSCLGFSTMKHTLASILIAAFSLLFPVAVNAQTTTYDVKIQIVSLETSGSNILINTNPRPTLDGSCTLDYWILLPTGVANSDRLLAMALSAQASNVDVDVTVIDGGSSYCMLDRLTIK